MITMKMMRSKRNNDVRCATLHLEKPSLPYSPSTSKDIYLVQNRDPVYKQSESPRNPKSLTWRLSILLSPAECVLRPPLTVAMPQTRRQFVKEMLMLIDAQGLILLGGFRGAW